MARQIKTLSVPHDNPFENVILPKIGVPSRNDPALKSVPRGLRGRPATWLTRAPKGGRGVVDSRPQPEGRRRVVAKVRYFDSLRRGGKHAAKLDGLGRYLGRLGSLDLGEEAEGHAAYLARESPFFSERSEHISPGDVAQAAAGERRTFEVILNPYDGDKLINKKFIRDYMREVERATGTRLAWFAVIHRADTVATENNRHAHIIIRGKDLLGREVRFSREFVKAGFRDIGERMATDRLGPMTERELERFRQVREANRGRSEELRRMDREGVSMRERRRFSKEWQRERETPSRSRQGRGRSD